MPITGNTDGLKPDVLTKLEKAAEELKDKYPDKKLHVESGMRDKASDMAKGRNLSAHWDGLAADVVIQGLNSEQIAELLRNAGFTGVYEYYNSDGTPASHAHGDVRGTDVADGTKYRNRPPDFGKYIDEGSRENRKWKRYRPEQGEEKDRDKPRCRHAEFFDCAYLVELNGIDTGEKCMGDHKNPWSVGCVYGVNIGRMTGGWIKAVASGDWTLDPCAVNCGIWGRVKRIIGRMRFSGKLSIITPAGAVTPAGTAFALNAAPDGATEVAVYEGDVVCCSKNSPEDKVVSCGEKYVMATSSTAVAVSAIDEADSRIFDKWLKADSDIENTTAREILRDVVIELPVGRMCYYSPPAENQNASTGPKGTFSPASLEYRGVTFSFTAARISDSFNERKAPGGKMFVIMEVTAKNNTSSRIFVSYEEEMKLIVLSEGGDNPAEFYNYWMATDFESGRSAKGVFLFLVVCSAAYSLKLQFGKANSPKIETTIAPSV